MNIQRSAPRPDRVWSPKIEERPVGEPYFRSAKVNKSELEKLPVRFGNAKDSFDVTFTYEAPVIDRELAATVPNDHIPQHWIGPRPDRAERPIYMNHPVTEMGTGRLLFQKQQVRVQVPELTEGHLQASFPDRMGVGKAALTFGGLGAAVGGLAGFATGLNPWILGALGAGVGAIAGGKHAQASREFQERKIAPTDAWLEWGEKSIDNQEFKGVKTTSWDDGYVSHDVEREVTELGSYYRPRLVGLLAGNKVQYKMIDDRMVRTSEMS